MPDISTPLLGLIGGTLLLLFTVIIAFVTRYKRCPSDRILVIYGRVGEGRSARCMHGGAAFVLPIVQDYQFLDLRPMSIDIQLNNALSKQNIRVSVPSTFTIGITTDVTDRHRAQQAAFRSERMAAMGTLAASVAHEINNPLAYVLEGLRGIEAELGQQASPRVRQLLTDVKEGSGRYFSSEAVGVAACPWSIHAALAR